MLKRAASVALTWVVLMVLAPATPVSGAESATVRVVPRSGEALVAVFDEAPLRDVAPLAEPVPITGDRTADMRIRLLAEGRGYRLRPVATGVTGTADGQPLHFAAAEAWGELDAAGQAAGVSMWVRSGFRDPDVQRAVFLGQLGGWSAESIISGRADEAIDRALARAAPPGYSKHQTGLAVDLAAASGSFGGSAAYAWLAADDFANARRHGFLPSYPPETAGMGPEPEPWEFVFVGRRRAIRGRG